MKNKVLEAALRYCEWGWHVLPLLPDTKVPLKGSNGVHDATNDIEKIRRWFTDAPDLNIGIAAGERSGLLVIDVDPRNGGEESWHRWREDHGEAPDGALQLTAGGGEHYLYEFDARVASCKLEEGIDVLADGLYFVVYPSVVNGKEYLWEASADPFDGIGPAVLPDKWIEVHQGKTASRSKLIIPDVIIKGNIHNGMVALAGAMRQYGMTEAEIYAAIKVSNETRCEVPLPASEVKRIARDVANYEADQDVALSVALGTQAAENLLAGIRKQKSEFYFTTGSSLMSQPSPIEWTVKHWLPRHGLWLMYGPSGVGKSFLALSIACSIANGMEWCGNKTREGYVVYMAGEGNFGMRSRIASWAMHHETYNLDKLLVSNRAVDMDAPNMAAKIVDNIKEMLPHGARVETIIIDTLNNHMSGDENSAQDFRNISNAATNIALIFDASVGIIHHTGNNEEQQHRARGSSAIKATMDSQIALKRVNEDTIEIKCTKMKDAMEPEPLFGELKSVDLGWVDEDGENQTGAVFVQSDHAPITVKPDKLHTDKKGFEAAWCAADYEVDDLGRPYLSRAAWMRWLTTDGGKTERAATAIMAKTDDKRFAAKAIKEGWMDSYWSGFSITEEEAAMHFLLLKNSISDS